MRGMRWGLKLNREGDKYESEIGNASMWKQLSTRLLKGAVQLFANT